MMKVILGGDVCSRGLDTVCAERGLWLEVPERRLEITLARGRGRTRGVRHRQPDERTTMKLPLRDYLALGLIAPAFVLRWCIRRWWDYSLGNEERHHQMLNYLVLMGYEFDGFNLNAYDSERTNHVFWCGNWPYAYGSYAMVFDGAEGVEIHRYGMETASLRNVILCRQMERAKWDSNPNTGRNLLHTVKGSMMGWVDYWAGWLRSMRR